MADPDPAAAALPYVGDDPGELRSAADRLAEAAGHLGRAADGVFDARSRLGTVWQGTAAEAGDRQLQVLMTAAEGGTARLAAGGRALLGCADTLDETRVEIGELRSRWSQEVRVLTVPGAAAPVALAGTGALDHTLAAWHAQASRAETATAVCVRAVAATIAGVDPAGASGLATALGLGHFTADDDFRSMRAGAAAEWDALGGTARQLVLAGVGPFPPPAAGPVDVGALWNALDPLQREALIQMLPAVVGALDGLPAAVRDRANRQLLAQAVAGPHAGAQLPDLLALQQQLDQVDVGGRPTPVYLMSFDPAHPDLVAVSLGNPDTACNVTVFVPGTGADLASVPGNLARAAGLQAAAAEAGATNTATVLWLNYDAPDDLIDATELTSARAGATSFGDFLDGLRVAHQGAAPASVTAVLHSYAAVLAAQAARSGPLAADQLVLLGAAGTGLESVQDIQLAGVPAEATGARVVAITAADDPILHTGFAHAGMAQDPEFGAQNLMSSGADLGGGDVAASVGIDVLLGVMGPGVSALTHPPDGRPHLWWDLDAHHGYFTDPGTQQLLGQLLARSFPHP